jgi:hypothetical protein
MSALGAVRIVAEICSNGNVAGSPCQALLPQSAGFVAMAAARTQRLHSVSSPVPCKLSIERMA